MEPFFASGIDSKVRRSQTQIIAILFTLLAFFAGLAQAESASWYATVMTANNTDESIILNDSTRKVELRGGWICMIGSTSKRLSAYEARNIACQCGEATFELSVQCESSRPKDHAQIRFKDSSGKHIDYIELGCELKK